MWLLELYQPNAEGGAEEAVLQDWHLGEGTFTVGRGIKCDVQIKDKPTVSREHASLTVKALSPQEVKAVHSRQPLQVHAIKPLQVREVETGNGVSVTSEWRVTALVVILARCR